jgi:hypothetical protein
MAWHPRLVVRFSKSGRVSLPQSGSDYVIQLCLAALFAGGFVVVAHGRPSSIAIAVGVLLWSLREVWAWFAASEEERAAFREEIRRLDLSGEKPSAYRARMGVKGNWEDVAWSLVGLVGFVVFVVTEHFPFIVVVPLGILFLASLAREIVLAVRGARGS